MRSNEKYGDKLKQNREKWDAETLSELLLAGDLNALSKALTFAESDLAEHRKLTYKLLSTIQEKSETLRIGITGTPGVGKSTFIESFGLYLVSKGHRVAVLAVDPSSSINKGSILGDKTRMTELSTHPSAFVRPSPSGLDLGGVTRHTREAILICEAAGYDTIIIETVGVGQSETAVHQMVDFFLLLLIAGGGDELQGMKRGITEMADGMMINKADGNNLKNVQKAIAEYKAAIHLYPPHDSGWTPKVLSCSALNGTGIEEGWDMIQDYIQLMKSGNRFSAKRKLQDLTWFNESMEAGITRVVLKNEIVQQKLNHLLGTMKTGEMSSVQALHEILSTIEKQFSQPS